MTDRDPSSAAKGGSLSGEEIVAACVWYWQGRGDRPESISCPVVMGADTLREILADRDEAVAAADEFIDILSKSTPTAEVETMVATAVATGCAPAEATARVGALALVLDAARKIDRDN